MFNYYDEFMNEFIVYEHDIVNKFDEYELLRKSCLNLRNNLGMWHVTRNYMIMSSWNYVLCEYVNPSASLVRSTSGWVAQHVLQVPVSLCDSPSSYILTVSLCE